MQEDEDGAHKELRDACHFHPSELAERRVRLVIGMKRYFHGKRLEGLLSVKVGPLVPPRPPLPSLPPLRHPRLMPGQPAARDWRLLGVRLLISIEQCYGGKFLGGSAPSHGVSPALVSYMERTLLEQSSMASA